MGQGVPPTSPRNHGEVLNLVGSGLTNLHQSCIMMHMRTTLNINDELLAKAAKFTGIREKTALVHAGLESLVQREAARRLAAMGGTQKGLMVPPRRRPDFGPLQRRAKKSK